jgi:hypothetical protein
LHVSLSPTAHPASVSEGTYSSIDVWEPSYLPYLWTKWREFSVRDVGPVSQSSSLPVFPPTIEESYSTLKVWPPFRSTGRHTSRSQSEVKFASPPGEKKKLSFSSFSFPFR